MSWARNFTVFRTARYHYVIIKLKRFDWVFSMETSYIRRSLARHTLSVLLTIRSSHAAPHALRVLAVKIGPVWCRFTTGIQREWNIME